MLGNSNIVSFVATANPDRAHTFYADVLGLKEIENTPFALVFDANGTVLRIQKVESVTPPPYTVLGWEVDDILGTVQGLSGRGVSFEIFDQLPQDVHGIWATPDGAQVAWFKDPDNNTLSLTQRQ